jgi:hypothetical protein
MLRARTAIRLSRRARGCTLIELLVFVAMLGFIIAGAKLGPEIIGGGYARLVGSILGFVTFVAAGAAWCLVMDYGVRGVPYLPTCRDGCCRGGDQYRLRKFGAQYNWVCRRGVRYERRGRRFVVVQDDGSESRYLIWRPFRGWAQDGQHSTTNR